MLKQIDIELSGLVLIGHSHTDAIGLAADAMARPFRLVHINKFKSHSVKRNDESYLDPALRSAVKTAASQLERPRFFSCIGGNAHNVMSLLRFQAPVDFVLSEQPDLPLDPAAQIVPEGAMLESMSLRARRQINLLKCFGSELNSKMAHIESPPPIGDNSYCTEKVGPAFRDKVAETGISPPILRYKMWRLHSRVFRIACENAGLQFISAPAESMDDSGFLARRYYGNATHANRRYGELVIRQLDGVK